MSNGDDDTTIVLPKAKAVEQKLEKWAAQRRLSLAAFASCWAWIPFVIYFPALMELSWAWFTLQGSVILAWYGGSTFSVMNKR